jgi:hypothetical protein
LARDHRGDPDDRVRALIPAQPENIRAVVKEKSHKGQRHKGCGLCDIEKRAGNSAARRPARDRRQLERAKAEIEAHHVTASHA